MPELNPGEWFRVEVVTATIFDAGETEPALFNLAAGNSVGGHQDGNDVGSIRPFNGLDGQDLNWTELSGSSNDRFGYGFWSRTDLGGLGAPNDGWIVWDNVQADDGSITLQVSTDGGGTGRGPVNALAVYVIPEPGTLVMLGISGLALLLVYHRRK